MSMYTHSLQFKNSWVNTSGESTLLLSGLERKNKYNFPTLSN